MNKLKTLFFSIIIGLAVAGIVFAWTNPTNNPPSGGGALYYYNGNVGIGTASPTNNKLHVAANGAFVDSNSGQLSLRGTDSTQVMFLGYDTTNNFGFIGASQQGVSVRNLALAPSGGNVGIGTTNPSSYGKFVVRGFQSTAVYGNVSSHFSDAVNSSLFISHATVSSVSNVSLYSDADLAFGTTPSGVATERLRITSSGNVGIGTSTPSKKLEVSGTLGFTGGTGPFCIFSNTCPSGWVDKGLGGYIYNNGTGATCPYSSGGAFNATWTWCHPRICCNQ